MSQNFIINFGLKIFPSSDKVYTNIKFQKSTDVKERLHALNIRYIVYISMKVRTVEKVTGIIGR